MSIKVKYVVANNSIHAKEPKQAMSGSDLFAAEAKKLFPRQVMPVSLELKM